MVKKSIARKRCATEARSRYGFEAPAMAHEELRERQAARVFGQRIEPSDEGLIESEPILGSMN